MTSTRNTEADRLAREREQDELAAASRERDAQAARHRAERIADNAPEGLQDPRLYEGTLSETHFDDVGQGCPGHPGSLLNLDAETIFCDGSCAADAD